MNQKKHEHLLQQKLDHFRDLLEITKDFLHKYDKENPKLEEIDKFFTSRKMIITKIKKLNNTLKSNSGRLEERINKEIGNMARSMADFDKRIFNILSKKKKKIIKEIKNVTDIKNRSTYKRGKSRKLVDIEG